MREFRNLVYLDLQKAATTSIVALLRQIVDEPEVEHGAHTEAMPGHDVDKFHFISVRDPLAIYISLFGHGCAGLGGMYAGFKKRGLAHLYQPSLAGFETWAAFMLDPANASQVKRRFHKSRLSAVCGPITYRLLMLSVVDPVTAMRREGFADRAHVRAFFEAGRIYDHYVRVESLVDDLFEIVGLCSERVAFKRLPATRDELASILPRKNVGAKIEGLVRDAVSDELKATIRAREWLIYEVFGYDRASRGSPPPLPPRGSISGQAPSARTDCPA